MYGYGIHTGLSDEGGTNHVMKIQGKRLLYVGPLESLAGKLRLGKSSPPKRWTELATAVAKELDDRGLHPLGVDSPLTLAQPSSDGGRAFESLVQTAFKTPDSFSPWPGGASRSFLVLARLWTEIAYLLVTEHRWTLWTGQQRTTGSKLLVEVYTRASWTSLAAAVGAPIEERYPRVAVLDGVMEGIGLRPPDDRTLTRDLRDGAVCAITTSNVVDRGAGFLGRPAEPDEKHRALVGGGIALPWLR